MLGKKNQEMAQKSLCPASASGAIQTCHVLPSVEIFIPSHVEDFTMNPQLLQPAARWLIYKHYFINFSPLDVKNEFFQKMAQKYVCPALKALIGVPACRI